MVELLREKANAQTPIHFGLGNGQNLPTPLLCNLRCAIGRVIHASGAGEAITEVSNDEEEVPKLGSLSTQPDTSDEYEYIYLKSKLQSYQAQGHGRASGPAIKLKDSPRSRSPYKKSRNEKARWS